MHPTSGSVQLLGQAMPRHAADVLPRVGALVGNPAAWPHLSERANLRLLDAAGRVPVQLGYLVVAFGAAWANFATKDVTSQCRTCHHCGVDGDGDTLTGHPARSGPSRVG